MEPKSPLARHIIIDLETLSERATAAVVSLGAVALDHNLRIVATFHTPIDAGMQSARHRCPRTIEWWRSQSLAAQGASLRAIGPLSPRRALQEFVVFVGQHADTKDVRLWGNGSGFDCSILEDLYNDHQIATPWHHRNERDLRTLLELYPQAQDVGVFEGEKHNALDDAMHEAKQLIKALQMHEDRTHAIQAIERAASAAATQKIVHTPCPVAV